MSINPTLQHAKTVNWNHVRLPSAGMWLVVWKRGHLRPAPEAGERASGAGRGAARPPCSGAHWRLSLQCKEVKKKRTWHPFPPSHRTRQMPTRWPQRREMKGKARSGFMELKTESRWKPGPMSTELAGDARRSPSPCKLAPRCRAGAGDPGVVMGRSRAPSTPPPPPGSGRTYL